MNITFSTKIKSIETGLFYTTLKQIEESVKVWGENERDLVKLKYTASHILKVTTVTSGFTYTIELAQNDGYFIVEYEGAFNGFLSHELMPQFWGQKVLEFESSIYGRFYDLELSSMMFHEWIEAAREIKIKEHKDLKDLLYCMRYTFNPDIQKDINTKRYFKEPSGNIHRVKGYRSTLIKSYIDLGFKEVSHAYILHDVPVMDKVEKYYIWESLDKILYVRDIISSPQVAETGIRTKLMNSEVSCAFYDFYCLKENDTPILLRCRIEESIPEIEEFRCLESDYNDLEYQDHQKVRSIIEFLSFKNLDEKYKGKYLRRTTDDGFEIVTDVFDIHVDMLYTKQVLHEKKGSEEYQAYRELEILSKEHEASRYMIVSMNREGGLIKSQYSFRYGVRAFVKFNSEAKCFVNGYEVEQEFFRLLEDEEDIYSEYKESFNGNFGFKEYFFVSMKAPSKDYTSWGRYNEGVEFHLSCDKSTPIDKITSTSEFYENDWMKNVSYINTNCATVRYKIKTYKEILALSK